MWGWKTVERLVEPSVSFSEAKAILQEQGFRLHASNPAHAVFKSDGTESGWTSIAPKGENAPLEMAIAATDQGLYLQLRYETFCLFDTGDLPRLADEMAVFLMTPDNPSNPELKETCDYRG